ncbi:60s ribosomal protein l12-like [Lynx pardinus]|uniref:60s ribosomal protein l12-like n=1 Tax=Lynx pardinus TaxID=191816 RepID=A0A485PR40_LYNPA|nr:60s ribosomal protein l12-like [Lynx pardinus]
MRSAVYPRYTGEDISATSTLTPKTGPLELSLKKVGDDIAKATGNWKGLRMTVKLTFGQTQIEVITSAFALIIKALEEPPREREAGKH